jgi:hypothetical protein
MVGNQLKIMFNESDISIEYSRIRQLLEQFTLNGKADFTIVFGAITVDGDYSTWSIPDDNFSTYNASGFLDLMLSLLSTFVEYKSQTTLFEHCHAIIKITPYDIAIEWVSKKVADNAIASSHEKDNVNYG